MQISRRLLVVILAFVGLGMPAAALAVAWPSMAQELGRSIGDLGVISAVSTIGYGSITLLAGRIVSTFGVGRVVVVSGWLSAGSLVGYAVTESWPVLLGAVVIHGLAAGGIDAGLNAYAAMEMDARGMNLMHAGFGLGATLGPWIVTLALGSGWRLGIGAVAGFVAIVAIVLSMTAWSWRFSDETTDEAEHPRLGLRPVVVFAVLLFLFYTGVELSLGQWSFTLLAEGRGVSPVLAGFAAGGFWAGLTLSRLVLGAIGARIPVGRILTVSGIGILAGAVLLWTTPVPWIGVVGLILAGFMCGPVFPLQMGRTPARVGRRAAPTMVGWQMAAATVGGGGLPWLIGNSVDAFGVESIGALIAVAAGALVLVDGVLRRATYAARIP